MDLMYADSVLTQAVIVAVVQVPDVVLREYEPSLIRTRKRVDIPCASGTSGLICKFPTEDAGLIDITADESVDVAFVRSNNLGVGVEIVMGGRTENLCDVDVHATIIAPVRC